MAAEAAEVAKVLGRPTGAAGQAHEGAVVTGYPVAELGSVIGREAGHDAIVHSRRRPRPGAGRRPCQTPVMDQTRVRDVIARTWADDVIPSLSGLIEIPALSPSFDADWAATGQLRAAVDHVANWVGSRGLGRPEVVELDGRAPLLMIDIPATAGAAARAR